GDTTMRDHMAYDGLHDIFTDQAMGNVTESKNQGVTLTATTTQRRGANTTATTPQLQRQMQRDPRPGHPQRMPHRDRATIDIHLAGIKSEFARGCDPHRRECLVDLHQIQILRVEPL